MTWLIIGIAAWFGFCAVFTAALHFMTLHRKPQPPKRQSPVLFLLRGGRR